MKHYLNTLYVTTQGSYLAKDGECVLVRVEGEDRLRLPIHGLGGIVCFGQVSCSPFLLGHCAENGVAVSFLTERGRFLARVQGPVSGNVLLRREQYRRADAPETSALVARCVLTGKIANSRTVLLRTARDHEDKVDAEALRGAAERLADCGRRLEPGLPLDVLRGIEGEAGNTYFEVFDHLLTNQKEDFRFTSRSRRPPLDRINCLLSFLTRCWPMTCVRPWSPWAWIQQWASCTATGPGGPAWLWISWRSSVLFWLTAWLCRWSIWARSKPKDSRWKRTAPCAWTTTRARRCWWLTRSASRKRCSIHF